MFRVSILLTAAMIAGGMTRAAQAESASVLLEKGIYQEETVGNLQSAMDIYQQIIADQQANRPFVAQAYYRLGMCYLKKNEKTKAAEMFLKLLKDYPEAVPFADKAGADLAKLEPAKSGPPMVVRTTPEAFANDVDPGLDKITVTFDRPMMDKSWSFTAGDKTFSDRTGSIFPERTGEISYDATRTTCTMPVKLQPGKVYWVGINSPSFQDFKAADGTPARHYMILFATKDKDGKPTPLPEDLVKQAREINDRSISIEPDALKTKLINWVEKFFSENYRDITARKTLEWGEPETLPNGNLAIRYKYLATIWDKDKLVIDQRFTFKPDGQYVSAETIEKGPATRPATVTDKVASEKYSAEGWRLWRQQKHAEAEEAFQKAVAEDPANTNAWNGLGWAQFNQGKPLAAEEAFKKCLEREPKHAAALNGLGWIEKNRNQNDKAIALWQKSLEASPEATAAMNGLAVTYMEMGRYEEAVKFYAMLVEKEPNNKEAKEGLAKAKVALEKK